jgi:hypothetical protein
MTLRKLAAVSLALASMAGLGACGDSEPTDTRGDVAVGLCREHGGVIAFDDEIVICRDQTTHVAE